MPADKWGQEGEDEIANLQEEVEQYALSLNACVCVRAYTLREAVPQWGNARAQLVATELIENNLHP